jgi:acyl-CoA thioesterase
MRKVDMTGFNAGRSPSQRRELLLYRLLAPLPRDDANSHVLVHAFEADRNGLLMAGNNLGMGRNLGTAASLSYSFYVHVNPDLAVMESSDVEDAGWWIQEVSFPRAGAGRATLMSKIWSPRGIHVATGYQDGVLRPAAGAKGTRL